MNMNERKTDKIIKQRIKKGDDYKGELTIPQRNPGDFLSMANDVWKKLNKKEDSDIDDETTLFE